MKRKLLLLVVGAGFAVSAMGAESCGTTETKNEPDAAGDKAAGSDSSGEKKEAPKKQVAGVGDSLTLDGGSGEKMQATVIKVLDPLPAGEFDQAESGNRLVGVQMSLKNTGDKQYDDSPSNGAVLLTTDDQQAQSTITSGGPCGGGFATSAKIAPGARQQGCIPFEVPTAGKLKTFQFTLSSGFGPQAGEWRLR